LRKHSKPQKYLVQKITCLLIVVIKNKRRDKKGSWGIDGGFEEIEPQIPFDF